VTTPNRSGPGQRSYTGRLRQVLRSGWLLAADATTSLVQRPGHTVGMISGIMLAVASAAAAMVIADTQQAQVDLRFDLQRSDRVVIQAENLTRDGFPAAQVDQSAQLEPVAAIGELSIWLQSARVGRSVPSSNSSSPVIVADSGGLRASGTSIVAGASADLLSSAGASQVAWVGENLAAELGIAPAGATQDGDSQIVVRGVPFSVAGIVGNDGAFGYLSSAVILSRQTALSTLGESGENVRIVAHVRPGSAASVANYLLRSIDTSGGGMGLRNVTPPDGEKLLADVGGDLRKIGAALAGIVGVVGLMGVANTLMLSVHQRKRELGLRSAMGWSRRRIGLLVLAESGVAGLLAGILGAGLGLAAAATWSWSQSWTLIVSPSLPLLVVGAAVTASLLGGLVPAVRAASVSPLSAMRS
jgi:putative ABC transport system permease protein